LPCRNPDQSSTCRRWPVGGRRKILEPQHAVGEDVGGAQRVGKPFRHGAEVLADHQAVRVLAGGGELGQQLGKDYAGKELTVICVLKGSFIFCADLVRAIPVPVSGKTFAMCRI
jgi:hypothetical protein